MYSTVQHSADLVRLHCPNKRITHFIFKTCLSPHQAITIKRRIQYLMHENYTLRMKEAHRYTSLKNSLKERSVCHLCECCSSVQHFRYHQGVRYINHAHLFSRQSSFRWLVVILCWIDDLLE